MISLNDLKEYLYDKDSLQNLLIAGDIANMDYQNITLDDNCKTALDILTKMIMKDCLL